MNLIDLEKIVEVEMRITMTTCIVTLRDAEGIGYKLAFSELDKPVLPAGECIITVGRKE